MNQKIIFKPATAEVEINEKCFFPASTMVPEWFKHIPPERQTPEVIPSTRMMSTVKKCVPFVDALTTGYMACLSQDVEFSKDEAGNHIAFWGYNREDITTIENDLEFRTHGISVPKEANNKTWRFHTGFHIITPKGYSTLVTHPLNRFDLPFNTLSAVIDTDSFERGLVVTMYLNKDFVGILKKGTPIAQIFPFKRTNWKSETIKAATKAELNKIRFDLMSVANRAYQTLYWKKKTYE